MNKYKTILQVPVSKSLRDQATKAASDMGFTSLQEVLRLLIKQIANRKLTVQLTYKEPDEILTPQQETILTKKYEQARKDIDSGKGFTSNSTQELIDFLEKA